MLGRCSNQIDDVYSHFLKAEIKRSDFEIKTNLENISKTLARPPGFLCEVSLRKKKKKRCSDSCSDFISKLHRIAAFSSTSISEFLKKLTLVDKQSCPLLLCCDQYLQRKEVKFTQRRSVTSQHNLTCQLISKILNKSKALKDI